MASTVSSAGIGAGPATIIFRDMMAGQTWDEPFTVSVNSNGTLDVRVSVSGEPAAWTTLTADNYDLSDDGGLELIPSKPMRGRVNLQIPDNLETGTYQGNIHIMSEPADGEGEGVSAPVGIGVNLDLIIFVTNKPRYSVKEHNLKVYDNYQGEPVIVEYAIENTGNIDIDAILRYDIMSLNSTLDNRRFWERKVKVEQNREMQNFLDVIPILDLPLGGYNLTFRISFGEDDLSADSRGFRIMHPGAELPVSIPPYTLTPTTRPQEPESTPETSSRLIIISLGLIILTVLIRLAVRGRRK
ncbi:MAG: hypothetical protein V1921_01630 [Candidatus Altiarchaeota archaeon]